MPDARVRVYAYTYMYDCLVTLPLGASPYVPSGHADVSPWPQPRSGLMSLCPSVLLFPALAATNPRYGASLMSLEATRTIVRGRQPLSGLMCILCKLMFLCSRGKRQAQTLYLMSLCPYVLLFPALAANAPSNKQAMVRRVTLPH